MRKHLKLLILLLCQANCLIKKKNANYNYLKNDFVFIKRESQNNLSQELFVESKATNSVNNRQLDRYEIARGNQFGIWLTDFEIRADINRRALGCVMSRFMALCFYLDVRAPSAANIRRGAIATDFHCAIRNRGCIIRTITESMKRNKSARL